MKVFANIEATINVTVTQVVNSLQSGWVADLTSVAKVSIALYVIFFGYMVLAGKIQLPFQDLLWALAKFGVILVFLSNTGGFLTAANDAVEGLKGFFAGGTNSFSLLDQKLDGIAKLGAQIWKEASGIKDSVIAVFRLAGLLPLLLGFTTAGAMLVFTEITLKILLATAPIFIFCLMWGFLKDSFNNWLSAILGNGLVILFTNVVMKFSFMLVKDALTNGGSSKGFIVPLILLVVGGLLTVMAVKWGREMALNLARVSVESGIGGGKWTQSSLSGLLNSKKGK